jgi:signal transduction histidine kinase
VTENRSKLISLETIDPKQLAAFLGSTPEVVKNAKQKLGVHSLYIVQLSARGRLSGFIVAGFYGLAEQVRPQDITLLDRLSEPVGVALDNRLLTEENRRVLAQLRRSNAKLKALDETKDEFITMASHQLRTPLTAVKGYLSMVLEGDAGKLNENQRKLLEQSFFSSQRMVFLISDLLNLSRLNTGKFIIESSPVQLAEVVEGEVQQLVETAKSREVSLLYKKPADFPVLLLDETKIHQVVMNFIDNAIYYTPAGGKITVTLTESPTSIEYRVKDNGIGVPREQQRHLFSKFYRADNARKARPDGTGLGLFMAKKVIAAQGGAIIFDSEEGKGSTFGFRFSKAHHLAPATPEPATAHAA